MRCVAADATLLASGSSDHAVRVWRAGSASRSGDAGDPPGTSGSGSAHTSTSGGGSGLPFDLAGERAVLEGHAGPVSCLQLTPSLIVSGSWDCSIRLWDRASLECVGMVHTGEWCSSVLGALVCRLLQGQQCVRGYGARRQGLCCRSGKYYTCLAPWVVAVETAAAGWLLGCWLCLDAAGALPWIAAALTRPTWLDCCSSQMTGCRPWPSREACWPPPAAPLCCCTGGAGSTGCCCTDANWSCAVCTCDVLAQQVCWFSCAESNPHSFPPLTCPTTPLLTHSSTPLTPLFTACPAALWPASAA